MRDVLGYSLRAVDLRCPLRDVTVHLAVIDLLERLAVDHVGADLADQQDQRRGILRRRMDADGGVGRAGPARHEGDAGAAGELAVGLGHVRRAALLPADDERQPVGDVVERIEHGEVAFARHAERVRGALCKQAGDEDFAAGAGGHRESVSGRSGDDSTRRPDAGSRRGAKRGGMYL